MATSKVNDTNGSLQAAEVALCGAPDLRRMLGQLADQIADADRRHSQALTNMQDRLGTLGATALGLREQVPLEMTPVLDRIEGGMAQLSDRIAEADAQRRQQTAVSAAAMAASSGQIEAAPALRSALAAGALESLARRSANVRSGGVAIDNFDVVDSASSARDEAAWDKEAAEALASLYDGERAELTEADLSAVAAPAPEADPIDAALETLALDREQAVAADKSKSVAADSTQIATEVAALQAKAMEGERKWLEQRLGDIAIRLEQSLSGASKSDPLETLDQRFTMLEDKLAEAMGGNAKSVELAGLKGIETQVEDLAAQLVSVQTHFSRLDIIELELRSLADRMSSEGLAKIFAGSAAREPDSEAIAGVVASRVAKEMPRFEQTLQAIASQLSADKIAGLIAQSKSSMPDAGAIAKLVADQVSQRLPHPSASGAGVAPQIDELRTMIQSLTDERRHGEEQTSTMLDTMQQAMIRLLDRMDAMEQAQVVEPGQYGETQLDYPETHRQGAGEPADHAAAFAGDPARPNGAGPEQRQASITMPVSQQPGHYATDASRGMEGAAPVAAAVASSLRLDPQSDQAPKAGSREDYVAAARRAARMAAESAPAGEAEDAASEPKKSLRKATKAAGGRQFSKAAMAMACLILVGASFFVMKSTLLGRAPATAPPKQSSAPSGVAGGGSAAVQAGPAERKLQNLEDADQIPSGTAGQDSRRSDATGRAGGPDRAFDGAIASAIPASQIQGQTGFPPTMPTALTREDAAVDGAKAKTTLPITIGPNSLRNSATKGDASAEFEIGARFAEGRGVTQDLQQAIVWYTRSAAQGFAPAQYRLGSMYERGLGVKPDNARARVWYGRAAAQGIVKAMHNLAVLSAGRDASASDYVEAAKWFQAAADHGLTDSQFNLAIMHDSGLGMERDSKLALKWFTLAARAGDEEAARRRESLRQKLLPQEAQQIDAEIAAWRPKSADQTMNDPRLAGEAWKARAQ